MVQARRPVRKLLKLYRQEMTVAWISKTSGDGEKWSDFWNMFWRQSWLADQLDVGSKWRATKDDQSLGSEQLIESWYDLLKLGRLERKKKEFTLGHETTIKHLTEIKSCRSFMTDVIGGKLK